jgi:hypothetical protein
MQYKMHFKHSDLATAPRLIYPYLLRMIDENFKLNLKTFIVCLKFMLLLKI